MPAPRMPWDPEPPQPCLTDQQIEEAVKQVIPEDFPAEPEEPNEAE